MNSSLAKFRCIGTFPKHVHPLNALAFFKVHERLPVILSYETYINKNIYRHAVQTLSMLVLLR